MADESVLQALVFGQDAAAAAVAAQDADAGSYRPYGPATGINWCERDYEITPWICEFWNTCTNIAYFYVGIRCILQARKLRLPPRFLG